MRNWFILLLLAYNSILTGQDSSFKKYEQLIPGSMVKFWMTPIPKGIFLMGSKDTDAGHRSDELPTHPVSIDAFWMGTMEVTYDEYQLYFNDESTSRNSKTDAVTRPSPPYIDFSMGMGKKDGFPFNSMSQQTALMYCRWLYTKTGVFYRLPTEAEWEYACRAGGNTIYFFGNSAAQLGEYAWFAGNSENKYHQVGTRQPNPWGLYDILGNVAEWTLDHYDEKYYSVSPAVDPLLSGPGRYPKVVRGGGYQDKADLLRCAARNKSEPAWNKRDPQVPKSRWWLTDAVSVGFRLVRPLKSPTKEEVDNFFKQYLGN
jgi:formylglycine-generating enzyme required for sulfatase activity